MSKHDTRTIAFRLLNRHADKVQQLAESKGLLPSEYIRRVVLRHMERAIQADAAAQAADARMSEIDRRSSK